MSSNQNLDLWWASLTVKEKERIATKSISKHGGDLEDAVYPACTDWWISLSEDRRQWIHDHCVDVHGDLLPEWKQGNPYGD